MKALTGKTSLLGTWELKSFVRISSNGEKSNLFGDHPSGYLNYSADGRMCAIGASAERPVSRRGPPSDEDRVKLFNTMFAYAGTYSIEPKKVTHHIDISWNQAWSGLDQVRFYKLEGNTLTLTAAPEKSPIDGTQGHFILIWDKVK